MHKELEGSACGAMRPRTRCRTARARPQTRERRLNPILATTRRTRLRAAEGSRGALSGAQRTCDRGTHRHLPGERHADLVLALVVPPPSDQPQPRLDLTRVPALLLRLYRRPALTPMQLSPSRRARRTRPTLRRRRRSAGSSCRPRSPRSCARSTACVSFTLLAARGFPARRRSQERGEER